MMYSQFFWLAALVLVGLEVAGARHWPRQGRAGRRCRRESLRTEKRTTR